MIKKAFIGITVLAVLVLAFLATFLLGSPEIIVSNQSTKSIAEVIVKLPSNRIVFGTVGPTSESKIYYSWLQADGAYEYQLLFSDGSTETGKCGYVTNHEFGKRLTLVINPDFSVTCNESRKV